jgi:hypothetical protein
MKIKTYKKQMTYNIFINGKKINFSCFFSLTLKNKKNISLKKKIDILNQNEKN